MAAYQWRRNGAAITPGGDQPDLVIDPISAADNGAVFDCVLTNANGPTISAAATLTVSGSPAPGGAYYASAVQAEPSLFAYFPVDGSTSPAVRNVRNPAFSGTVNGDAASTTRSAARSPRRPGSASMTPILRFLSVHLRPLRRARFC